MPPKTPTRYEGPVTALPPLPESEGQGFGDLPWCMLQGFGVARILAPICVQCGRLLYRKQSLPAGRGNWACKKCRKRSPTPRAERARQERRRR